MTNPTDSKQPDSMVYFIDDNLEIQQGKKIGETGKFDIDSNCVSRYREIVEITKHVYAWYGTYPTVSEARIAQLRLKVEKLEEENRAKAAKKWFEFWK